MLKTFVCAYQEDIAAFDFNPYLGGKDLYAIRKKDSGELIGIFVECEVDVENHTLEIGYGIVTQHWGRGYMTEVVRAMLSYYFHQTAFCTVYASFFPENSASRRAMERCGMVFSHIKEKEFTYLGKERDLVYYKIEA